MKYLVQLRNISLSLYPYIYIYIYIYIFLQELYFGFFPNHVGKGTYQVSDFICDTDTFSAKTCGKTFKTQSGIINCSSPKVVYLLKCRICGKAPYVGKVKTKFRERFNDHKSAHRSYKTNVKYHSSVFMNIMGNTVIMGLMIDSSY